MFLSIWGHQLIARQRVERIYNALDLNLVDYKVDSQRRYTLLCVNSNNLVPNDIVLQLVHAAFNFSFFLILKQACTQPLHYLTIKYSLLSFYTVACGGPSESESHRMGWALFRHVENSAPSPSSFSGQLNSQSLIS